MSVSSSQSRVTITLNLTGQAATVRGIQQTEAALKSLGDTAGVTDEKLTAAAETSSSAVTAANREIAASADTASASMKAQADTAEASAVKTADTTEASAARITAASKASTGGIMGLLTSFKALSIGATTYLGVKSFTGYSTALTRLSTLAGLTQGQVASLNAEIMRTAPALRQSPTALAQAAYSPASERFGLAGTEQVMRYAAQLTNLSGNPIGGGAGSTSYAISTMLQTLGMAPTAANVAKVTAMIRGTTSAGDMQLTDLTGAMSSGILNTGKTYGINPEATLGALAYFTSQGVPAQEAATRMRMTESLLVGQSAQAAKYAKALGLSATTGSESALSAQLAGLGLSPTKMSSLISSGPGGLVQAFDLINRSLSTLPAGQREAVWAKLFGGGRTDATAMQLAQGAMSGKLMSFTNAVIGSSTVGGLNQATDQYNKSPQGQLKKFEAQLQTFATEFGAVVMPVLEQLMGILGPLLGLFAQHKILLDALVLLIGGELALKLFGLVRNLKLVGSVLSGIRDVKAFDSIISGAGTAESAVGKLIQKMLGVNQAWAGMSTVEGASGAAGGAAGVETAGIGTLAGAGAAASVPLAVAGGALGLAAWGIFGGRQTNAAASLLPAGATPAQVRAGTNYATLTPQQWAQVAANASGIPGYARGGVTNGPMAIVGEGSAAWPEYVVPTDPTYRGRALALFQALGGHLLGPGMPQMLIAMGVSKAGGHTATAGGTAGGSGGSNVALGQRMAAALGWTGTEWAALNALWQRESAWSTTATNPTSGAYGIPQALPASKLPFAAQAAGGSHAAAQILWGLQYVKQRYHDPVGAWGHEQNFGWYAKGGVLPFASYDSGGLLPEGISLAHNGTGKPEPVGHDLVPAGGGGDLTVNVVVDGKTVGQTVIADFKRRTARL